MIELHAEYAMETNHAKQSVADFAINQIVARDLKQRGLSAADIISRERVENGVEVEYDVSDEKRAFLRYCDKIIIPGDE